MLAIHAQPGSKRSAVAGVVPEARGEALKVRLAAPPVEGRANEELVTLLAESLGVPRRSVTVVKGGTSRHKSVLVTSPQADLARLLKDSS